MHIQKKALATIITVIVVCSTIALSLFLIKPSYALYTAISSSSLTSPLQPSHLQQVVRTSEGTIHAFIQQGTSTTTCSGSPTSGLIYSTSSDNGVTWACKSQLSSDTTNAFFADAKVDSSDNIYVTYSVTANGGNSAYDTLYRKISKDSGSNWTVNTAQTVFDGNGTTAYSYATIAPEGSTRLWIAARYFDGTSYKVQVYYSDSQGTSPSWTVSQAAITTESTSTTYHIPALARYSSNIALVTYEFNGSNGSYLWRFRQPSDGLTTWHGTQSLGTTSATLVPFSLVGDTNGRLFFAQNNSTTVRFDSFNSIGWLNNLFTVSSSSGGQMVGISTDGNSAWVYYDTSSEPSVSYAADLPSRRHIVYRKIAAPYTDTTFMESTATRVDTQHGFFDAAWVYDDSAVTKYASEITDMGDSGTADVLHATSGRLVRDASDAAYFGETDKFDGISLSLSTNGSGGTLAWEYCSAVDGSNACTTWSSLTFTASSNTNLTGDAWAAFTPPSDWAASIVSTDATPYYYIRVRVTVSMTTGPIGSQMNNFAPISGLQVVPNTSGNGIVSMWSENSSAPITIRSANTTVTTKTGATYAEINPKVITYTSDSDDLFNPNPNTNTRIIKSSSGILHTFVQAGSTSRVCNGQYLSGLLWYQSNDNGTTWECKGQLDNSGEERRMPVAAIDSSDNMYVAYSEFYSCGPGTTFDVLYHKLTKGSGSTWTLGAQQTVWDGDAVIGYCSVSLTLEDSDAIWIAARASDGSANPSLHIKYTTSLVDAPTWSDSANPLVSDTSIDNLVPALVHYSDRTGVVYMDASSNLTWHSRADSDLKTSWSSASIIVDSTYACVADPFAAVGTNGGNVFVFNSNCTDGYLTYFDGSAWKGPAKIASNVGSIQGLSLDTDNNPWVTYTSETGLNGSMTFHGKPYIRKILLPLVSTDEVGAENSFVTAFGAFDAVYRETTGAYTDFTTAASNSTSADITSIFQNVDDAVYFGKSSTFDFISWMLSTNGSSTGRSVWEYYDGSTWKGIQVMPVAVGIKFTARGYFSFQPPNDWATTTISDATARYYIRNRVTGTYATKPVGTQFSTIPYLFNSTILQSFTDSLPFIFTDTDHSIASDSFVSRVRYSTYDTSTYAFGGVTDPTWSASHEESFESGMPSSDWTHSGNTTWTTSTTYAVNGTNTAKSGAIGHSESSNITWDVTVPVDSKLRFYWRVSSEEDADYGVFCLNNTGCTSASGYTERLTGESTLWEVGRADLAAGSHSLTWKYQKDGSVAVGNDALYVDHISIWADSTPTPTPTSTPTSTPTPSSVAPSATPTPTPTPTPVTTITPIPVPTNTPSPSPTATATPTLAPNQILSNPTITTLSVTSHSTEDDITISFNHPVIQIVVGWGTESPDEMSMVFDGWTLGTTVTLTDLEPETLYVYKVQGILEDGTRTDTTYGEFITMEGASSGEQTGVIVLNINVMDITDTKATVEWITNLPTTSVVEYGETESLGTVEQDDTLTTTHSLELSKLSPATEYHYQIVTEVPETTLVQRTETRTFSTLAPGALVTSTFLSNILWGDPTLRAVSLVILLITGFISRLILLLFAFFVNWQLLRFISFAQIPSLILGFIIPKKKPWGVVYDSVTKTALDPVLLTLKSTDNTEKSTISDFYGRYEFLVPPGEYTLDAQKTNYRFPSQTITIPADEQVYSNVYLGGSITAKHNEQVAYNIPMDQTAQDWNMEQKRHLVNMRFMMHGERIASAILYAGFITTLLITITNFSLLNMLILGVYFFVIRNHLSHLQLTRWGTVFDKNGTPLSGAIIRLINVTFPNARKPPLVTDANGRYCFLVESGTFRIMVSLLNENREEQIVYTSNQIHVSKKYDTIAKNITLP